MNSVQSFCFYLIISFISIFFMKIGIKNRNKNKKIYFIFIFLSFSILLVINIFRSSSVGTDYIQVGDMYSQIVKNEFNIEKTYQWFGKPLTIICIGIGKIFGDNPIVFYTFIGFFTIFFMYKFILNSCKYPTASLSVYLMFCMYLQSFNQARQMLAVAIVLFSIRYIESNNIKKYFIFIILASFIHESAVIFLPLYFMKNIQFNKKAILIYLIGFLIFYFEFEIIERLISYTKYYNYFSSQYNIQNVFSTYMNAIVRVLLLFLVLSFRNKYDLKTNKKMNFIYHMVAICTILQFCAIKYYFFGRLTTYFYSFYILILPEIIDLFLKKFTNQSRKVVMMAIILLGLLYYWVYYNSASGAVGSGYSRYSMYIFED